MGARPPALSSILVAVAYALSVFGFTLFVWMSFGGTIPLQPRGYTAHVIFGAEASQLAANAEVRTAGVPIGKVASVSRISTGTNALIELDRRYAPLRADARAIVRVKTLLGEAFIELSPGSRGAPAVPEGGTLAQSQVEPVQAVDEVLGSFDKPTRDALRVFLTDLSASLDGRGQDVNSALGNLPSTVEELTELAELLDRQEPALRGVLRNGAVTLHAVGRRSRELQQLVVEGNRLLDATAGRDRQLTATVRGLPGLLKDLDATVEHLEGTAEDAAPTLDELHPVAPLVRPALEGTSVLAPQLERLFADLGKALPTVRTGLSSATRVTDAAGPLVDVLHRTAPHLLPVIKVLNEYRRDGISTMAKLGAANNGIVIRDSGFEARYAKVMAPVWNETVVGFEERLGSNRYNPYLRPGGVAEMKRDGLEAFDCRNVANPTVPPSLGGSGPPDCIRQHPWSFQGESRSFPHVKPYEFPDFP